MVKYLSSGWCGGGDRYCSGLDQPSRHRARSIRLDGERRKGEGKER